MTPYRIQSLAGKPYRPSNGIEGRDFMSSYCDRCARDAAYRDGTGDSCPIAARSIGCLVDDPEYPTEWTHTSVGEPTCTAFEAEAEGS